MEKLKVGKYSLKRQFIVGTAWVVLLVLCASAASLYAGWRLQKWILPDANEAWLTARITYADGRVTENGQLIRLGKDGQEWNRFVQGKEDDSPGNGETSGNASSMGEKEFFIAEIQKDDNGKIALTEDEKEKFRDIYKDILPENYVDAEKIQFSVVRKNPEVSELTPERRLAYRGISVGMFVLPIVYALIGVGLWGIYFYRRRLAPPLTELSQATEHIRRQDLDFSVNYESRDELGQLCRSFEKMRQTLSDNNRKMWEMMENRKKLQESVAHDLRNPTAILSGYVEYLQKSVPLGKVPQEKLMHILSNLASCAKRIGQYTESMRDINQIEDLAVCPKECNLQEILDDMIRDFSVLAGQHRLVLDAENEVLSGQAEFDVQCFYRILENLFSNSLRFAKERIVLRFSEEDGMLRTVISDDGPGFSAQHLLKNETLFYSGSDGSHKGIGLTVSRILSCKLGGYLKIGNGPEGGARVEVWVKLQKKWES